MLGWISAKLSNPKTLTCTVSAGKVGGAGEGGLKDLGKMEAQTRKSDTRGTA